MKRILIAAIAVSLATVTQVGALTVNVNALAGYHLGSGGEFNVNPITGVGYAPSVLVGGGFETFCVAQNVSIAVPGTYDATVDANGTYISALPGTTKTISMGTAYLYQQFATGVLNHYNYTPGSNGSANPATWLRADAAYQLQLAIWALEGTYSYPNFTVNVFLNDIIGGGKQFASLAAAMAANNSGGFGVGTLRLTTIGGQNPGTPVQGMLTLLPDGGTTLMLMGIGFSSLALVSRKFRA